MKIAIATCHEYPSLINEEKQVSKELSNYFDVFNEIWDNNEVNWKSYDVIIIRTVWDYYYKIEKFKKWLNYLKSLNIPVFNPLKAIFFNLNKTYLDILKTKNIPVIPSFILNDIDRFNTEIKKRFSETDNLVIKPAISAGGYKTIIKPVKQINRDFLNDYSKYAPNGIILQEYLPEIKKNGEWSLIFFNGIFSHAVNKKPANEEFRVQLEHGGSLTFHHPSENIFNVSLYTLKTAEEITGANFLFARIDGVETKKGYHIMEIELIEPNLYLYQENLQKKFVSAIINKINKKNIENN